jgi:FkbM family methyltransferase
MRKIREIGEHSVYVPGLQDGGYVLDVGANRGRFGSAIAAEFPVRIISIEANPILAALLRQKGIQVVECALGATDGSVDFNIGHNDEASSTRTAAAGNAQLVVKETVHVDMKALTTVLDEHTISGVVCVKLDIEGGEIEVLMSVGAQASQIAPQWTVEFHDGPEFQLCKGTEVDTTIAAMRSAGFSVLVRNWPALTNVLFLKRDALSIGLFEWVALKIRYQYLAVVWRKCIGLR